MASSNIRSIRILREPTFGALSSTTGLPDETLFDGSNDLPLDVNRADITTVGEVVINDRDDIRGGFYTVPGDVVTVLDANGDRVHRRTGQFSVTMNLRGLGSQDSDDNPLVWMLAAGMTDGGKPTLAQETIAAHVDAQTIEIGDENDYDVGQIIQTVTRGNRAEFAGIVDKASFPLLRYTPAFSAELADNDVIYACRTFASNLGTVGNSLAFRLDGSDFRTYAFGCRPSSFAFSGNERRAQVTVTFDCAYIYDDHENASTASVARVPYRTDADVMHTLNSEVVISDPIDTDDAAYPRIDRALSLCVDEWSATITNTLDPVTCWGSVLGMAEMEVTDRTCEITFTITPTSELKNDLINRTHRNVMVGFGPGGAGQGMCIFMPGGHLTTDPNKRDLGGPRIRQAITFSAGYWGGDTVDNTISQTPLRIGITDGGG